jgi:hypothetical protein
MDGQRNTLNGSSGRPGALLQIYNFAEEFAVHNILQYYFGTGEDDEKPGSIPGDTVQTLSILDSPCLVRKTQN